MRFVGSCCIRIFYNSKQNSPCLIIISLLFDDSCKGKKGTCPSDLAIVLSGRHNTHLVTLSSMSVAHYILAFFQHHFVFSFTLMHLHNFNICSLMFLSFNNISNGTQWTGPHSLQINKYTHIATGTQNNFIFYQSMLQHASYLLLSVFKTVTMPRQTTQQNFTFLGLVAAILNWGHTHYNRSYMNPVHVYTAYTLYTVTPQPEGPKNTVTNCICICTPRFYVTACLNIVINFCSMPASRLKTVGGKQIRYFAASHDSYI